MPRIGVLTSGSLASDAAWIEAFRQGLRDLGYVEGHNIAIEYRYGEGKTERYPALVTELSNAPWRSLWSGERPPRGRPPGYHADPLVMANVTDPVALGLVASLARPGGNLTGVSNLAPELGGSGWSCSRSSCPSWHAWQSSGIPAVPATPPCRREMESAARAFGVQVHSVEVREPHPDFAGAFATITRDRADALLTLAQPLIEVYQQQIVDFTATRRLPAIFHRRGLWTRGALCPMGRMPRTSTDAPPPSWTKFSTARRPAELPVEQPVKFDLVINLKTAKELGLTIPPSLLFQADEVIQ